MSHTIELKKVSKYYAGEDSVSMGFSRVDLDLDIGEFVAITGESGSGKSTLLNVISGLDTYEEGEMFVCGEDTTAYGTEDYEIYRKTYIGNIFQDFNLINSYTVYQNIEVVMLLSGKKKKECRERVLELIDLVGLSEYRRTKVSRLSGGQKQRVAIARALAKDAPIIVADEPTGNLDSASAESVMETLSRVSGDKLVVIVTHNYEQAEPYVTRKLTMHDGKIIEDKRIAAPRGNINTEDEYTEDEYAEAISVEEGPAVEREGRTARRGNRSVRSEAAKPNRMRKGSEIRLGLRNTFNLPTKFILLFIVYFFVSTAVLAQYATIKNSMHEEALLGNNPYFFNANPDRIIVKKADESRFEEADCNKILNTPNIAAVVKNDFAVDNGVSFDLGEFVIEGPVLPVSQVSGSELTFGHMPEDDHEIVVRIDATSDAYVTISGSGEAYIDRPVLMKDMGQTQAYDFDKEIRIAGIIVDDDVEENTGYSMYGYSTVYVSDAVSNELLVSMMAAASKSEMTFGRVRVENESERTVFASPDVPEGKVYIFEDQTYYYEDEAAKGENFAIRISNRFFESEGSYKVAEVLTEKNCGKLAGIPADEYDMYYNCVFLNNKDFKKLFDKGFFQISAYMENEQDSEETLQALNEMGYTTLAIKDSLSDSTDGYSVVIGLLNYGRLALIFIVLFFIAYGVIKLIMRSRNSYYSTLRILGATKKNTDNILRVELILMMIIAYAVDMVFVLLVHFKYIDVEKITKLLNYLAPPDYGLLAAALLLMSLMIANRYSRHIFTKSAMKAFREEA